MKEFELVRLYRSGPWWVAAVYSRTEHYFKDLRFEGYTKKQVIYKLRHDEDVEVGRVALSV